MWVTGRIYDGVVQVWVAKKWARGNLTEILVTQQQIHFVRNQFTIRKVFCWPDPAYFYHADRVGFTNNAEFMGYPAGTVVYTGWTLHPFDLTGSTSRTTAVNGTIDWHFEYNSLGAFDNTGIVLGYFVTDADLSGEWVNGGDWVDAATLGWDAEPLAQADFGSFA